MPDLSTANIPYEEYRAIAALMAEWRQAQADALRAVLVFGDMVATGQSRTIQLLAVVEGYSGVRHAEFTSTSTLPLRGRLHLYFLTPTEFEEPNQQTVPEAGWSSAELIERVLPAYSILLEQPAGYARNVLNRLESRLFVSQPRREEPEIDPFSFVRHRAGTQTSG